MVDERFSVEETSAGTKAVVLVANVSPLVWPADLVGLFVLPVGGLDLCDRLRDCPFCWVKVLVDLVLHPEFLPARESPIPDKVGKPAIAPILPLRPAIPRGLNPKL